MLQPALMALGAAGIHPGCLWRAAQLLPVVYSSSTAAAGLSRAAALGVRAGGDAWASNTHSSRGFASRGMTGDGLAPSSFESAITELQREAKLPSNVWPGTPESQALLRKVDEAVGGRWLLTECGTYLEPHPLAGRPARTLMHLALCNLWYEEDEAHAAAASINPGLLDDFDRRTSSSRMKRRGRGKGGNNPDAILPLRDPVPLATLPPGSQPRLYCACYELDDKWHVTGRMHGSASQFEALTDKKNNKKPDASFKVVWGGRSRESLHVWRKNRLGAHPYRIESPTKGQIFHVTEWYRGVVEEVGVVVMATPSAAQRSVLEKKARDAERAAAAAAADADGM